MGVKSKPAVRFGTGETPADAIDFDLDAFATAIAAKGYDVAWQQAMLCPNRTRGGLSPKDHPVNCRVCDGSGYYYYRETETQMLITGVSLSQGFYAFGQWDAGQVMVTALPSMRLKPWDRLVLHNGVGLMSEVLRRQPDSSQDRPKYLPLCVDQLVWVNRTGQLRVFVQDEDFTVSSDGYISWTTTTRPDNNTYYSVVYMYRPRYIVMDLPHQHRESSMKATHHEFPVQAIAKLEYQIRDEGTDAAQIHDQSPFPEK